MTAPCAATLNAIGCTLAIIEFTPDGQVLSANDAFCALLGYRPQELRGQHHAVFLAPMEVSGTAYAAFWAALGRGEVQTGEFRRVAKDGREVWIEGAYSPVQDRHGRVTKVVKVAADITARKLEARKTAAKFGVVSRVQGIIEFTPDGDVLAANENVLMVLGCKLGEIVGQRRRLFVDPVYAASGEYEAFWRTLRSGEDVIGQFRRFGSGGAEVWISATYTPVFDADGKVVKVIKLANDFARRVKAATAIAEGLAQLSANKLQHRVEAVFSSEYACLKIDFNGAMQALETAMRNVLGAVGTICVGTGEITQASDDLSRRTEQQSASLEESRAAMDEITATLRNSAQCAVQASQSSASARQTAESSGMVMPAAGPAAGEIKSSADKVSQIIGVSDEIDFQASLLASKGAVQAAVAGKHFAELASEVRALASDIAAASGGEQAIGLSQINTVINQMDQVTQQNAAMVEQSTAASHARSQEAGALAELAWRFRVSGPVERPAPAPAAAARRHRPMVALCAVKQSRPDQDDREEFWPTATSSATAATEAFVRSLFVLYDEEADGSGRVVSLKARPAGDGNGLGPDEGRLEIEEELLALEGLSVATLLQFGTPVSLTPSRSGARIRSLDPQAFDDLLVLAVSTMRSPPAPVWRRPCKTPRHTAASLRTKARDGG